MAYTAVVEKLSVTKISSTLFNASIKMTVNDGQSDIFETTVSEQYNTNAPDLTGIEDRLKDKLVERWDKFAAENDIFTAAAFDTMVSNIQSAANTYINQ